jgi:hypothetical protein
MIRVIILIKINMLFLFLFDGKKKSNDINWDFKKNHDTLKKR